MISNRYNVWHEGEYTYPVMGHFQPFLVSYIHDEDEEKHPVIIVVPGGAYCACSPTEGEIVALRFYEKGYNTFVMTYTTNLLMNNPLKLQPLKDLSRAVVVVRSMQKELHLMENAVTVCGFSAGGHLTASLGVHFDAPELIETGVYAGISNRPDSLLLSYPVISSGEYAHKDTFTALLGADASEEELAYMSLEHHVTPQTPPAFIWSTWTDEAVPVENSLMYADALRKAGVQVELHLFGNGEHGRSLSDEDWLYKGMNGAYTLDQIVELVQAMLDQGIPVPKEMTMGIEIPAGCSVREMLSAGLPQIGDSNHVDDGIKQWPDLADAWLAKRRAE